jgi:multiple sugar transport system ATP-binding protein
MNFMRGRLTRRDGLGLDFGFMHVPLNGHQGVSPQAPDGSEVVAGLRPEDLQLTAAGVPGHGAVRLSAQLELVEPVGNETFLTARAGSAELVLRTPPHVLPQVGETVALTFAAERLHLFDAASGRRL